MKLSGSLRFGLIGFAIAGAAMITPQLVSAQFLGGHNSNAPVDYAADRIELQDRQGRVVLSGNVDITQANLRLRAARTVVSYSNAGNLSINRIEATGGVTVLRGSETARGDVAVYDFDRRIITMVGNVAIRRGSDTLNGGRLVINLESGVTSMDGRASGGSPAISGVETPPVSSGSGGRVSGRFTVPQRD